MPRLVSLLQWQDAKSDPPPHDDEATLLHEYIVVRHQLTGMPVMAYWGKGAWHPLYSSSVIEFDMWAERPLVGSLTDTHLRYAINVLEEKAKDTGDAVALGCAISLRVALDGEIDQKTSDRLQAYMKNCEGIS